MAGVRDFPAPRHETFGRAGWCKWCGERIPEVIDGKRSTQRMWHPHCARLYNLHTRQDDQYRMLVERDGERCRQCPDGTPTPMRWLRGPEVVEYQRMPAFGHLARVGTDEWIALAEAWREENPPPRYREVSRVTALEVDHRVPLWSVADLPDEDRRWYFGPGNLWLLCPTHHRAKTAAEAAQRAAIRAGCRRERQDMLPGM